jgi:hypothetical protein
MSPKSLTQAGITGQHPYVKAEELENVPFLIEVAGRVYRDAGNAQHGVKAHDRIDFQIRFADRKRAILSLTAYSSRIKIADAVRSDGALGPLTIESQQTKNGTFHAIVDHDKKKHGARQRPRLFGEDGEGVSPTVGPGRVEDALSAVDRFDAIAEQATAEEDDDDLPF